MNDELFFSTSDLVLATTLSLTIPIEQLNKANPKRVLFIFPNSSELKAIVDEFWLKNVRVEPQNFAEQLRSLKVALHGEK